MSFPSELSDDVLAEEFATTLPSIDFYHRENRSECFISADLVVCTCIQCMETSSFILPHSILFKLFEQSRDEEGGRVPQAESKKEGGVRREGEMACYCSSKHMHLRLWTGGQLASLYLHTGSMFHSPHPCPIKF